MPLLDHRTIATSKKGKMSTSGRRVVTYVDGKGETYDATVIAQGSASGLKLRVPSLKLIADNVPKAANMGSVTCYRAR